MGATVRITFVGDIMCEKPLQQAYDTYGAEVFCRVFSQTKSLFSASEYVVGNLDYIKAHSNVNKPLGHLARYNN